MKQPVVIEIKDLEKTYGIDDDVVVRAIRGVDLTVRKGEYVSIMGASGSGKSTFMNILGFLDTPTAGTYLLEGIDGSTLDEDQKADIRNLKIGFVFQGFNLLSRTSALENVELPLFYRGDITGNELTKKAARLLDMVGLGGRGDHVPSKLSGGEQQRVAIARSLINDPAIVLADEPTGNLDTKNTTDIMELFTSLNREMGLTIIMVTHEPEVSAYTDRVVMFRDGLIIDDSPVKKTKKKRSTAGKTTTSKKAKGKTSKKTVSKNKS